MEEETRKFNSDAKQHFKSHSNILYLLLFIYWLWYKHLCPSLVMGVCWSSKESLSAAYRKCQDSPPIDSYEVCPCAYVTRWRLDGTRKDSMQPKESNCTVGVHMFLLNRREWDSIVMDYLEFTACYTTEKNKPNLIELKQK